MTPLSVPHEFEHISATADLALRQLHLLLRSAGHHAEQISSAYNAQLTEVSKRMQALSQLMVSAPQDAIMKQWGTYLLDAQQRVILTLDVLRERGNIDLVHEAAGTPPLLRYDHELVVDGRELKRPVNYMLLQILPPQGVEVSHKKRPYMIIDPRAGHGAGIGGFKEDSQVGVALHAGHPVYFVAFRPHSEPGQTLADVMRAEAEFVRAIARRHPKAPKPVVVGNCQGGWAAMLLAAANPDITGPLVINGAPLAYWSGRVGENPMRYNGGLLGGVIPALVLSDLGYGEFDGVHLVANFEQLNPSRHLWSKYYDLYKNIDTARTRFLEFERWWGGFQFMAEAEIRWIVEQLFVGNRLARGEARIERGRHLDLKQIRSPIILFASYGDNITPPQQALNWIVDTYADENEIKIRGQKIIYMIHERIGHLGIFVSSSVARREHVEIASTLETVEAMPPGLYEMVIEDQQGEGFHASFLVSFRERKMEDLAVIDDGRAGDEEPFAAVSRLSELNSELYDLYMRPFLRSVATPQSAAMARALHPMRLQRIMFSDRNPAMIIVSVLARQARTARIAVGDNIFRVAEEVWADLIAKNLDLYRDVRDAWSELTFYAIYASPLMNWVGRTHNFQRTRKDPQELRFLPEVQTHLLHIERGGFAEAVIRMLIILAHSRGSVRLSRLERSAHVMSHDEPFVSLGAERRARLIHEQSVIVEFEKDKSIQALAKLLHSPNDRRRAIEVVEYIVGPIEEMLPATIEALQTFRQVLDLPSLEGGPPGADHLAEAG